MTNVIDEHSFFQLFKKIGDPIDDHAHGEPNVNKESYTSTSKRIFTLLSTPRDECEDVGAYGNVVSLLEPGNFYRFRDGAAATFLNIFKLSRTQSEAKNYIGQVSVFTQYKVPAKCQLYYTASCMLDMRLVQCVTQQDYILLFEDLSKDEPSAKNSLIFLAASKYLKCIMASQKYQKKRIPAKLITSLLIEKGPDDIYLTTTCNEIL
jgi:hypothetical protein